MKTKLKVLRIIGECKTGGTETIALNYYKELDHKKIGMDFLFYGESLQRFNDVLNKNGDHVINIELYTKNMIKSILQIRDAVKAGNYDIVHAQLNALNFFPLFGAWLGGAKVRLASNHSTANMKYEFKKSLVKYILRPTVKLVATHYAACSEYAGAWLFGQKNIDNGKVKVIHNAIDLSKYSYQDEERESVRKEMGWTGKFVIGHAGRFIAQKNHRFIIEVFKEVHKEFPESILVLAGEGNLQQEIKQKVENLGLSEYVHFLGLRFDMDRLMQGLDVFLFPSLYEGLGNVVTEAQAVGLHIVASDVVPQEVKMTEYVDFLSLSDSVEKWAATVCQYIGGYSRVDTHKILTENGYEICTAAKALEDYYISLIGENEV